MRKYRAPKDIVQIEIVYPTACRYCKREVATEKQAITRNIISKGRDPYTRAPVTRRTLLPFCSARCADEYQNQTDRDA